MRNREKGGKENKGWWLGEAGRKEQEEKERERRETGLVMSEQAKAVKAAKRESCEKHPQTVFPHNLT